MSAAYPRVSERRLCRVVGLNRATIRRTHRAPRERPGRLASELVTRLEALIHQHPTFGYRRLWALLRFRQGQRITPKTVYRILKLQSWFVHQRPVTPRPRVQGRRSQAPLPQVDNFAAARREIVAWIRWYNEARPHQALGYRSPREHRAHEAHLVA